LDGPLLTTIIDMFFKKEPSEEDYDDIFFNVMTYMTIAEFFMMRPHGPNCWNGLGAFNDRVLKSFGLDMVVVVLSVSELSELSSSSKMTSLSF
jgi:hypothetical protein